MSDLIPAYCQCSISYRVPHPGGIQRFPIVSDEPLSSTLVSRVPHPGVDAFLGGCYGSTATTDGRRYAFA